MPNRRKLITGPSKYAPQFITAIVAIRMTEATAIIGRHKLNEYNWDDGFEIPKQILAAPSCDLALALEIFYLSDGYAFLDDSTKTTDLKEWGKFIAVLYDDILNDKFPKTSTAFEIPLSQVQKYKLQKKGISKNFLTDL